MKLLIFKVNHLGDTVVFLPVIQTLRSLLPGACLKVVTTPVEAELYRGILRPHEIFAPASRPEFCHCWRLRPWSVPGWLLQFACFQADACLISYDQGNFAHLAGRWLGGRVRIGANLGHVRIRESITKEVPVPPDQSIARWNWDMGSALIRAVDPSLIWPEQMPAPDLAHLVGRHPATDDRPIVIHAGSKAAIRQWPVDRYAELAGRLARRHPVVWIDRPETRGVQLPTGVRSVRSDTLRDLVSLLAASRLFVGNNSGPMHLANALGTPGVIVSGPSHPGWDPAWYHARWTIMRHPALPCLPCENPSIGVNHCINTVEPLACLRYWSVDQVESACAIRLASPPGA